MHSDQKASINVSIPYEQRAAFYEALAVLKQEDGGLFTSASSLIVRAVIDAAQRRRAGDAAPAAMPQANGASHAG
jgi:hypothetical protein